MNTSQFAHLLAHVPAQVLRLDLHVHLLPAPLGRHARRRTAGRLVLAEALAAVHVHEVRLLVAEEAHQHLLLHPREGDLDGGGRQLALFNSPISGLNLRFGILICKLKCKLGRNEEDCPSPFETTHFELSKMED